MESYRTKITQRQHQKVEESIVQLLTVKTAVTIHMAIVQGIISFDFRRKLSERNRWCNLIKRQHGKDDFSVNSSTVVCSDHFEKEDIISKLGGRWDLKKGKFCFHWYFLQVTGHCFTSTESILNIIISSFFFVLNK